ncbi:MAG: S8 family peptidase [Bacteroidota bacterium]|nr:S8 family peptidase [Bacteroidota bacterium]
MIFRECLLVSFFCFTLCFVQSFAQQIEHQYVIRLKPGYQKNNLLDASLRSNSIKINSIKELNNQGNLLKINFQEQVSKDSELRWLSSHFAIDIFQSSKKLQQRNCPPNDPSYSKQWNMQQQDIENVWCYNTSGISPLGDTLVIGVIDFGFDFSIDDILPNTYKNHLEIPDNQKDDDNNGYEDDYYGYDSRQGGGDDHVKEPHGTQVASVVGAKGNNGIGITGVNQHVKLLLCSATDDAELIECYYYFIKMKQDYLFSNGKEGAFIVGTNCSLGFDDAFPNEFLLICQAYEDLGKVGILNAVATVNENVDIAIKGDIPTLCPSLYMIGVTNTDRSDQKVRDAGFNKEHVDIGASGEDITMTSLGGILTEAGGCSFASPHVAGVISLLSQFCPKLNQLMKRAPDSAALLIRSFILNCGDANSSLQGITSSGKRLNALKSLKCLNDYCYEFRGEEPLIIYNVPSRDMIQFDFRPKDFGNYTIEIVSMLGAQVWSQAFEFIPGSPVDMSVNTESWSSGIYFINIQGEGQTLSKSIIKI